MCDSVKPRTAAHQAPPSMGLSRQEYCSGLRCPPPGDLPNPGIELISPESPALQVGSLPLNNLESSLKGFSSVQSLSRVRLFATP